jgi:hypothetical protein|nr:hypothetical protein [Methylorubrum extorquens]
MGQSFHPGSLAVLVVEDDALLRAEAVDLCTGLVDGGIGTAVSFAGWDVAERTFPTLDGSNPGRLMCWLALNADGEIVAAAPTRTAVEGMVAGKTGISFCFASLDPERKEFVSSD